MWMCKCCSVRGPVSSSVQSAPALLHRGPAANLAVAWEKDVSLWELALAPSAGQGQQAAPAGQQSANAGARSPRQADDLLAGGAPRQLHAWQAPHLVVGAAWLDAHCLAVLSEAGPDLHMQLLDAAGEVHLGCAHAWHCMGPAQAAVRRCQGAPASELSMYLALGGGSVRLCWCEVVLAQGGQDLHR